jgi:hypothetical protein
MSFGAAPFGTTPFGGETGGVAYSATGAISTQFGSPTSAYWQIQQATGAAPSTQFGTANVYPGYTPSLGLITQFGTSAGPQRWQHVNAGPTTRIPRAYYTFAQTLTTVGAVRTIFGVPLGTLRSTTPVDRTVYAYGMTVIAFGTPVASWPQTGVATNFRDTQLPVPSAIRQGTVVGFLSTTWGTSSGRFSQRVAAIPRPAFGIVSARRTQTAIGAQLTQRFGTSTAYRPNTYSVYGFMHGSRFGQPTGFTRINRTTTGFVSTQLGTPAAQQRHRATMMAPTTIFGIPLLNRSTVC